MRDNGMTTGRVIELRDGQIIVSRADEAGRIVFANQDFVEISGFSEAELLNQPHNIIRHPNMPAAVFADTPQPPEISAHAAYVMDADTGDTLYAKNADDRAYPGSTTKIMTGILGVELGKAQGKMDQPLNITNDVYNIESDASVLGIDPGDQIPCAMP